jgi:hypothetical protein
MADATNATAPDRGDTAAAFETNAAAAGAEVDFLAILSAAEIRNQTFIGAIQRNSWQQSIKAFHSQHPVDSKYRTDAYRNRTKLFKPKTRAAVRKNLASAASALFSNTDVVSVKAQYDDNPVKLASAKVIHELLNYRLDRTTARAGIPWFLIAMGACLDGQLQGICVSKQLWEFETVDEIHATTIVESVVDPVSQEPIFGEDGLPLTQSREERVTKTRRTKDRPMSINMPPENVICDLAAPWYDPVQGGDYWSVVHPMTISQAKTMLKNPGKSGEAWLPVTDEQLEATSQDYTAKGVRLARGKGTDRLDNRGDADPAAGKVKHGIVFMYENFCRVDGVDYHYWSVGTRVYASKVRKTEEAYPEQFGDRPYTMGYAALETHQLFPMSPVEAWRPLQNELNDQTNLRIDILKQALSPPLKVRQGTIFDWKQVQRRGGPDATVVVAKMDDLEYLQPPSPTGASMAEMNYMSADFDELSGSFSTSSVQTNRSLNETVGGMRLMSGAANGVTEFDLRVWTETWVEPTLRQIVRLEQYYEDDQTILAICSQRAKMERFGVEQITDEDLMEEVSLRVNVGSGATDPMQRIQKLAAGLQILGTAAPFFDRPTKLNAEEIS